ncbi:MAG: peptidylprolyl isomerase [Acidimicrobiia bacterium]|nr:peptidylprolyl isomerase [Acidimicrobiia bacterium]
MRLDAQRAATSRSNRFRQLRVVGGVVGAVLLAALVVSVLSEDDKPTATTATTATTAPTSGGDAAIGDTACPPADGSGERTTSFTSGPVSCIDVTKTYTAEVVTSKGDFTIELDPSKAPKAVNNFVFLARNHYYDGVSFHRIIPGFVVQGGDATGEPPGTGGPGYSFADELPTDGPPYYEVGSLAMANSGPDTNGSQFYIVTGEQGVKLPAQYSLFGDVTEGLDTVVKSIEATGTPEGTPSSSTTITSVTITES